MQQRPFRRPPLAAATLACGLLLGASAWPQNRPQPDPVHIYAGNYSSSCHIPGAARLKVLRDALVVEQGDKRIVGHQVEALATDHRGLKPPYARVTLESKVHSGAKLRFMVLDDSSGVSITLQADASLQGALGKVLLNSRYRRCEEAKPLRDAASIASNEPVSEAEKILLNPQFRSTYLRALGPLGQERWLVQLDGPRPPIRRVHAAGLDYVLVAVCKAHDCIEHNIALLYAAERGQLYGQIYQQGKTTLIGDPPREVADALDSLWTNQWQRK